MGELTGFTRSYLAPAPDSPWTWADGGKVLCWRTGTTIAFLPEVRAVLARVAREAEVVPPFLAVALLLYALRGEPRGTLSAKFTGWLRDELQGGDASPRTRMAAFLSIPHLERGLGVLSRIPAEIWGRAEAKELVAAAVFEAGCVRRDPSQAVLLARALEHGLPPWSFATRAEITGRPVEAWHEAFSVLLHGLARFEPEGLALRARTGLGALPAPAELSLDLRGRARELIEELEHDEELGEVARLAHRLLATLYVPRPLGAREDLPIGGVSDIANKGSFERLLPSELAHDDLTLAVRIALNEALYTRRESPPRPRTGARCVLLDTGIRMWGLPRVFAAAVGLALAAGAERGRTVALWRPGAGRLERVDLARREGLVELLAALDPAPHPGACVEEFLAEVERAGPGSEAFLVTHERVLADPAFRASARQLGDALVHAVLVDGTGHLSVRARTPRGARTVHAAKLDLATLLRRPAAEAALPASAQELPAFLQILPSPLLLPHDLQQSWLDVTPYGLVAAWTPEQELAIWLGQAWCGSLVAHLGGPRRVWLFECEGVGPGVVHLVKSDEQGCVLWLRHDIQRGETTVERLGDEPEGLQAAVLLGSDLLLAGTSAAWLVEGAGCARRVTRLSASWLGGRFFRTREHALARLRLAPGGPSFEPLPCRFPADAREIQTCFERGRLGVPWGLARAGRELLAFHTESGERMRLRGHHLPENVRFTRQSRDCQRFLDPTGRWLLDLRVEEISRSGTDSNFRAFHRRAWFPVRLGMRNRLQAIGRAQDGRLVVSDRRGQVLVFRKLGGNGSRAIVLAPEESGAVTRLVPFERARLGDARIGSVATSPRGDRAFLDRRGLLHLVPADRARPQASVLLPVDRPTAVWSSDGRVHGPELFTGPQGRGDAGPEAMFALLSQFAEGFA